MTYDYKSLERFSMFLVYDLGLDRIHWYLNTPSKEGAGLNDSYLETNPCVHSNYYYSDYMEDPSSIYQTYVKEALKWDKL